MSEDTKKYIETGETEHSSYREFEFVDNIEKKIDRLPDRLELLYEDVELLKNADRAAEMDVDRDKFRDCWLRIIGADDGFYDSYEELYEYSAADEDLRPSSGLVEFGRSLGCMANNLYMMNERKLSERWDIVWGFIDGLCISRGESFENATHRREVMDALIEFLEDRTEEEAKIDRLLSSEKRRARRNRKEAERKIVTVLEDVEGEINPIWIREAIEERKTQDGETPPEWYADEDWDVDEDITEEDIKKVIEEEEVKDKVHVLNKSREDIGELDGTEWRGVEAIELIRAVHRADKGRVSSEVINREIHDLRSHYSDKNRKDYSRQIPKLAEDLTGDDWFRPIFKETEGRWELTAYGKLVASRLSPPRNIVGSNDTYPSNPSPRVLERAVEEIDI